MPLYQLGKFFYVPGRLEKVKKTRMYRQPGRRASRSLAAVLLRPPAAHRDGRHGDPAPRRRARLRRRPQGRPAGRGLTSRRATRSSKGQRLARLENKDLDMEIAKLDGKEKQYEAQLENLRREGPARPQAAARDSRRSKRP